VGAGSWNSVRSNAAGSWVTVLPNSRAVETREQSLAPKPSLHWHSFLAGSAALATQVPWLEQLRGQSSAGRMAKQRDGMPLA